MDYLIIIISVTAILLGAVLGFFISQKFKTKTDSDINHSQSIIDEETSSIKETGSSLDQNDLDLSEYCTKKEFDKLQKEKTKQIQELIELKAELLSCKISYDQLNREKNIPANTNESKDDDFNIENSSLKGELDELRNEIEDLEDEISDLNKKISDLNHKNSVLDDSLYKVEKEKEEIFSENFKNREELESVKIKNKKQNENLGFINDILNSNDAINEKFDEIGNKTLEIISFIENDLKYSLEYFDNNLINENFLIDCWNWHNQEIKTWIKNKKVIAIVGEFSAGKTSIVNRILKQDNPHAIELPVKSSETTAIPTYISKGIDFNCQFYSTSGNLKNITTESFQKVTKSLIDNINISSIVKYFVLSYNNKNLSDISILDTPGFGSNSKEVVSKTTDIVKEADALFWVVDANTGEINNSSINVIKGNLQKVPLYIIINKSDTKSQNDLELLQKKIKETLKKNSIEYENVIFFSYRMEIVELMNILNSISIKKSSKIIPKVNGFIEVTLKKANDSLIQLKKKERILRNNIVIKQGEINKTIQDIAYSLDDMNRVIFLEKSLFFKDYHKIKKDDYVKFENNNKKILDSNHKLPNYIKEFVSKSDYHSEIVKEINNQKRSISELLKSKKTLQILIKNYNPKLLN
jgi:predicted GTPase